jgi:hypothetical protein
VIDRKDMARRLYVLNRFIGIGDLARRLGTTIATLDKMICYQGGRESTYVRILSALERLEAEAPGIRWHALLDARRRGYHHFLRLVALERDAVRHESAMPLLRTRAS